MFSHECAYQESTMIIRVEFVLLEPGVIHDLKVESSSTDFVTLTCGNILALRESIKPSDFDYICSTLDEFSMMIEFERTVGEEQYYTTSPDVMVQWIKANEEKSLDKSFLLPRTIIEYLWKIGH